MSFNVNWNLLESESMSQWTKELLSQTLNSGKRPNILASDIEIKDLNFGKISPNFEILEIGELDKDRFRGIFKVDYDGDAHITLHTKVQANPLKMYSDNLEELENKIGGSSDFISPNFMLANDQFSLPLDLKLSDIKILGIGIIVFSKTKGLTLVFRNDPLDSIKVSSTFDMVQVLANYLQKQIENQIRELFRETLPTVLHKLSLKYISLNSSDELFKMNTNLNQNELPNDVTLFDLNNEFSNYSVKNLQANLNLFNSRETLDLHIPKFKNVIQRSHLEKMNKKLLPNLFTSLKLLNNSSGTCTPGDGNTNNSINDGIPINLLIDNDDQQLENTLNNISNIQLNNYYKFNGNNVVKPKRRSIKIGNKLNKVKSTRETTATSLSSTTALPSPEQNTTATFDDTTVIMDKELEDQEDTKANSSIDETPKLLQSPIKTIKPMSSTDFIDTTSVNNEDIIHPRPSKFKPVHSHSHFHRNFYNNSPNNSNSSLLSGVGIGNNYFNFTNKDYIDDATVNYTDLKSVKDKLHEIQQRLYYNDHDYMKAAPPPPPYQI